MINYIHFQHAAKQIHSKKNIKNPKFTTNLQIIHGVCYDIVCYDELKLNDML